MQADKRRGALIREGSRVCGLEQKTACLGRVEDVMLGVEAGGRRGEDGAWRLGAVCTAFLARRGGR